MGVSVCRSRDTPVVRQALTTVSHELRGGNLEWVGGQKQLPWIWWAIGVPASWKPEVSPFFVTVVPACVDGGSGRPASVPGLGVVEKTGPSRPAGASGMSGCRTSVHLAWVTRPEAVVEKTA